MSYLKVKQVSSLVQLFQALPDRYLPLMQYAKGVMDGPSELSRLEREEIGLVVSALNGCRYCIDEQRAQLSALGLKSSRIRACAIGSLELVDDKMRVMLEYIVKLTLSMERIRPYEVEAVFNAGWSEAAFEDAVCISGLFTQLNTLATGLGLDALVGDDTSGRAVGRPGDFGRDIRQSVAGL